MAYRMYDLSVLAYANGFTLWHYVTKDTVSEVRSVDYFSDRDMTKVRDMVICNCGDGNTIVWVE